MEKYLADPSSVEPPYNVGMACALCHVSFNPNNPPKDPANPKWENITSAIGNQYFREGMLVGYDMPKRDTFIYQYLYHQQPGTSETSRYPTDFINGPILINSIYRLGDRLKLARPSVSRPLSVISSSPCTRHVGLSRRTIREERYGANRRYAHAEGPSCPNGRGRFDGHPDGLDARVRQ